jgi:hypothetical protein
MTDLPIIFSGPMVRALLAGRKTMTRRLAKREGRWHNRASPWVRVKPGDRLWVRENISQRPLPSILTGEPTNAIVAAYEADDEDVVESMGFNLVPWWKGGGTLPCIHMPRWASRLTLVVTATKLEPLQDITEEDARAEGVEDPEAFERLWSELHGAKSWKGNPEVVALSFDVHKANFERMRAA